MLEDREVQRYQRELRAMLRRAGDEDPEGFASIAGLLTAACESLAPAAEMAKARHRYSWADLAGPFGVSRQAMQQRFGVDPEHFDRCCRTGAAVASGTGWIAYLGRVISEKVSA